MDNLDKTVENIVNYCKNIGECKNCVFNFNKNLLEENDCGINSPQTWKGLNSDKKDYLLKVKENTKLKEDLQKAQSEVQYYKEIYFGGSIDGKE